MINLDKVVYRAEATVTGGRDGRGVTSDKHLDVSLSVPKEMGGPGGEGTNPEQLFAVGYSACFMGALKLVAGKEKIRVSPDASITGLVGFGPVSGGYGIEVELKISLPGVERKQAQELVEKAHGVCPYSNATRGNTKVTLTVL